MKFVLEDCRDGIHEALRINKELGEPARCLENAHQRGAGQFRLILQIGQHIRRGTHAEGYLLIRDAYSRGGDTASGHTELTSTHVDLRRFDLVHPAQSCHSPCHQLVSLEFYTIGGFRFDALPQSLKLRTELHISAQTVRAFIPVFTDMSFDLVGRQQVNHCGCEIAMYVWKIE